MAFEREFCATNTVKVGAIGKSVWFYDTTDAAADVSAANYFVGAVDIGMEVGDEVRVRQWTDLPNSARSVEYRKDGDVLKSDAAPVAAFFVMITDIDLDPVSYTHLTLPTIYSV